MALQGMRVMPGEKLFDVADLSTIWIIADVYEYELSSIRVGETASIGLSYIPGKEFKSKIDYVYPTLSGETRTARVRFSIPNPDGRLKPQMYSTVEIKINLGSKLSIPDDAVIDTGARQIVYVDKGEGYFEPREVMLGLRAEGYREVLMGLKAGEKVAAAAAFLVDSEAQLKGVKPLEKK
jgi:Cu(I)/Ag(I) efflux system membrane fusion protein